MKKVFTFFAAMAMLASVSFAQTHRTQPGEKIAISPAAAFKHQLGRTASAATPKAVGDTISSFPWLEDFESGNTPAGFSFIDADLDGFNWDATYLYGEGYGYNGSNGMIGSASYDYNTEEALTPNDWMILPVFEIPATANDFTLSWYERSQDSNYAEEYYSVYISTNGRTVNDFTATTAVYSGYSTGYWVKRTVDLSSYAGQTIYVAFRHYNCTDMFYLTIDNIRIGGPEPPTMNLLGPTATPTNIPATYVAMSSASTIDWYVDGTQQNTTGDTLVYTFTTVGMHEVVASATNNVGTTSDTLEVDVFSCEGITIPYLPTFDGGLGCWTSRSDSTESGWYASVTMFGSDPEGQVLSLSAESFWGIFMQDFPTDNWLFSPAIEMPSTGEFELAWQVKPYSSSYDGDHYGVYFIHSGDTLLLFEESLTGMADNAYTQRMAIIPSAGVSGDFQVAFRHFNSANGYAIILDSIQVRPLTAPQVTLAGPTTVENGHTATFTASAPNATSFEWTINDAPVSATDNVLTHSFSTDGLYTIKVLASNTAGNSEDSLVVEVYTCNDINVFPYTQDFEGGIRCWTVITADPANDDRIGIDTTHVSGNYGFRFSSYSRAADYNQYLISPELTLPATGDYMVKFKYMGYNSNEWFRVLASTTTNDTTAFTTELGAYTTTETDWTEVAFLLPNNAKYIAIDYFGNYQYYLYVDDITIQELDVVPTVTLSGPSTAEAGETVTFVAHAPLASSFTWTVDGVADNTNGNTLTTSFATAGNHTVTVVANNNIGSSTPTSATIDIYTCDPIDAPWVEGFEGNTSCWKFVTLDGISYGFIVNPNGQNQYSHSGDYCLFGTYSDDVNTDQWAISPAINIPTDAQGYKLSYYVRMTSWEGIKTKYEVRLSNTGTETSDFSTILKSEQDSTGTYVQRIVDMSQYAGQTIYLAFRNLTPMGGDAMMIDDIEISNTVGINEVAESALNLYPNPATSMVSVSAEGIEGNVTVQIVDLNGRVMMQQQGNAQSFRFDVSTLAQGAYFVRMTGENINAIRKLVVK